MPRKSAAAFLREVLRAHRLERLLSEVGQRVVLTGRVIEANIVREKVVLVLFEKWPDPGCVSIWFAKNPAKMGLQGDPAAWVGRIVRVEGVLEPGSWENTFWIAVNDPAQIETLAEELVAE